MNVLQALIMGLVQGLTEFLPVSSSAHLVFADHFLHLHLSEADTVSFDVLLHLGTLIAVLIFFRRDVVELLRGGYQLIIRRGAAWRSNPYSRLFALLVIGTVPAAIAGVALKDFFSAAFQNIPGTAALLFVTAAMLIWITRRKTGERTMESATWKDALTIGAFQAFAILPGISRSGSTITGGLLRGFDREAAPRFSFLLSIPIILAGGLFDMKDTLQTGFSMPIPQLVVGFLAAAVSGYAAVVLLLGIVRRGRLDRFAYYCIPVAFGMLFYWNFLVPQVDMRTVYMKPVTVTDQHGAYHLGTSDELGPIELGQAVTFQLAVKPGFVPVRDVYAILPAGVHDHHAPVRARFIPLAGKSAFVSETYKLLPLGAHYEPSAAGDVREVWVIIRNKWGIQNEVRLRVRVVPESMQSRLA